jgi:hypothetical protein
MTHPGFGHMRASDAERERAVDVLKAAFAEGRLTKDEYADRVGQVHVSKTYGDLAALTGDLPIGPAHPSAVPYRGYPPALDGPYPPTPFYPLSSGYAPVWGPAYAPVGPYYPRPTLAVPRQRDPLAVTSLALVRIRQTGKLGQNFAVAGIALGTLGTLIFITLIVSALAGA